MRSFVKTENTRQILNRKLGHGGARRGTEPMMDVRRSSSPSSTRLDVLPLWSRTAMSSHRSTLSPRLPGSSASSSRTVRPRDYSHLGQPSSSTHDLPVASPPSPARPTTLSSQADELSTGLLGHSTSQSAPTQLELEDLTGCLYLLKRILDDGTPTDGPRRRRRRANERAQEDGRAVVQAVNEMLDRQRNEEGDDQESQDELAHALLTPWPVEHAQAETLSGELSLPRPAAQPALHLRLFSSSAPPRTPVRITDVPSQPSIARRRSGGALVVWAALGIELSGRVVSRRGCSRSTGRALHTQVSCQRALTFMSIH